MTNEEVKWNIAPEDVWKQFRKDPKRFEDQAITVCERAFDDADKKWWIFAEIDFNGEGLLLSVENSEVIIDSVICTSYDSTVNAINRLLKMVT